MINLGCMLARPRGGASSEGGELGRGGYPYHTIVKEETDGNDALAFKILLPVHSDPLHVKFPDILHLCISILWV